MVKTRVVPVVTLVVTLCFAAHGQDTQPWVRSADPADECNPAIALRVNLLGTGTPIPVARQFSMSTLIEVGDQKFLFDCGRGATIRLHQLKVPFESVDKLFITHHHSDHVVGIPDLLLTGWIMGRRNSPLRVWGPSGTSNMMVHLQRAFVEDIIIRRDLDPGFDGEGVKVDAHDIREGKVYDSNDIIVTAFRVDHGKIKPAFGYRLDIGDLSVGLSGDTRPSENLINHCRGVDVMIHECATSQGGPPGLSREQVRKHRESKRTFPDQAGVVFSRIKPRLAVFSHIENDDKSVEQIIRGCREHFSGPMVVGEDLMQIQMTRSEIAIRKDGKLLNLIRARKVVGKH